MRLWSLVLTAMLMLFAALLGVVAVPTPTRADVYDLTCVASSTTTYEPGLTNTSKETVITQKGTADPCFSPSHPDITSGTWTLRVTGMNSCVGGSGGGSFTYNWNNGESSTEESKLTISTHPQGQTVNLVEGRIIKGVFAGDITRAQTVRPNTDLAACQTEEGLTSSTGPRTIEFLSP